MFDDVDTAQALLSQHRLAAFLASPDYDPDCPPTPPGGSRSRSTTPQALVGVVWDGGWGGVTGVVAVARVVWQEWCCRSGVAGVVLHDWCSRGGGWGGGFGGVAGVLSGCSLYVPGFFIYHYISSPPPSLQPLPVGQCGAELAHQALQSSGTVTRLPNNSVAFVADDITARIRLSSPGSQGEGEGPKG